MGVDIYINGDISIDAFVEFSQELSAMEDSRHTKPVKVLLVSDGGDANAALAFLDRIRTSPLEIHVKATGIVASAAVLVLAAGDHRTMTQSAWVMVHEESIEGIDGSNVTTLERHAKHFRRIENQWSNILSCLTPTGKDKWLELHKNETYLNPQECLDLGLIEEIV